MIKLYKIFKLALLSHLLTLLLLSACQEKRRDHTQVPKPSTPRESEGETDTDQVPIPPTPRESEEETELIEVKVYTKTTKGVAKRPTVRRRVGAVKQFILEKDSVFIDINVNNSEKSLSMECISESGAGEIQVTESRNSLLKQLVYKPCKTGEHTVLIEVYDDSGVRQRKIITFEVVKEIDSVGHNFETALTSALRYFRNEDAMRLIRKGADVSARDGNGRTPLHVIAEAGIHMNETKDKKEVIIKLLLERGAAINATDNLGNTPLHLAVQVLADDDKTVALVEILLDEGAGINVENEDGDTPLHLAVLNEGDKVVDLVKFLVSQGADRQATNEEGQTPLQRAESYGRIAVKECLEREL
ncbi:MAG: ankyrin repeat domain-containing protein [Cytophagales bacterium]|nr:ankyrin repeat domain-containing protein [Cytophagales bacterium]